jgi:hypothetical protein
MGRVIDLIQKGIEEDLDFLIKNKVSWKRIFGLIEEAYPEIETYSIVKRKQNEYLDTH